MAAEPTLWILSRGRKGDLDQMLALARALGWPFEVKTLSFAGPEIPVLSSFLLRNRLMPPWPDVVLCAEASPSVIAKAIKRRSGRTRIVCLGRPAGSAQDFDLVLTTAQYRLPAAPNVVELSMPLAAEASASGAAAPEGPIAVLVGGPAFPDRLDAAAADEMAARLLDFAASRGRLLSVQTSPRTPKEAVEVLRGRLTAPHQLGIFGAGENRYRAVLAEASEIVVTSDSVSMAADALATGKPVSIYPLPQQHSFKWRAGEWLHAHAMVKRHILLSPVRWLFEAGVIEAAPDRRALFARLAREGRIAWFGERAAAPAVAQGVPDLETAVESLRHLMSR